MNKRNEYDYLNVRTMQRVNGNEPGYVGTSSENTILKTTDYGQFNLDRLNRHVRPDKVERLMNAISQRNLLHLFPIVVTQQHVVVDGQHRLRAAELLEVPIYYIVSNQMQVQDAAHINEATDRWTTADYMHHWCSIGLPSYLNLQLFHLQFEWLPLSKAIELCHFGDSTNKTKDGHSLRTRFAEGLYEANDIPFAIRICQAVADFAPWFRSAKTATFASAVRQLLSNADYDHARMLQKMQYQSTKLVRCADVDSYLAVLSEIYNYRVPADRHVILRKLGHQNPKYRTDRK